MITTIQNLKENPSIALIGKYIRLKGTAEIISSGKYFDLAQEKTKDCKINNSILISPKQSFRFR